MNRLKVWETLTSVYHYLKRYEQYDVIIAQGGTSSSKTISILQRLGDFAIMEPGCIISVIGQDLPNLKKGALRDFKALISQNPAFSFFISNPKAKEGPFEFTNGSLIEFVSFGSAQDAKSGKRDYSFFNEANGIPYEIYFEVEQRTKRRAYIDFNPTAQFWAHTEVLPQPNAHGFISTFMDNEHCPEKIRAKIKSYFHKWKQTGQSYWENKWRVYGLGLTGIVEGMVYQDWKVIDRFPDKKELSNFGYHLDWGFANDPLALARCGNRKGTGCYVGQELIYETGLNAYSLDELFPTLGILKSEPIVADSSNLDAIDWLAKKGWNIVPADKPPGSVKQGIELTNQVGIEVVQGSKNFIYELGNYVYKQRAGIFDKNQPTDKDNHLLDGMTYWNRYAILNKGVNPKKTKTAKRKFWTA